MNVWDQIFCLFSIKVNLMDSDKSLQGLSGYQKFGKRVSRVGQKYPGTEGPFL